MLKFIRAAALSCALVGSLPLGLVAAPASAQQDVGLYSCVYNCGAGPDGHGGVPADEYEACKANCEEIYGTGSPR